MQHTLKIVTFNIHKGFTHFNAHFALQNQRDFLRKLHADVIFLQEVQDKHFKSTKHDAVAAISRQSEYLADTIWPEFAYGKNSVYPAGHHGNSLLSKFPITKIINKDISAHATEARGMLHCEIKVTGWDTPLHAICIHLGLFAHWRRQQLITIAEYIEQHVPVNAPLIIAGDFNDWSMRSGRTFAARLHLHEAFEHHLGKPARSFPAWLPMLRMDRIYVRGFKVQHAEVHAGVHFLKMSDHAILSATLLKT